VTVNSGTGSSLRVITQADYLRPPSPRYPPLAHRLGLQGVVLVRVTIAMTGEPVRVEIERSSGFRLLDDAALAAVRKAWFRPLLESGTARVVEALIPVDFSTDPMARA
jgi:protein TonB